ncbi:hypothetical protein A7J50_1739 [Pseudomonas antarctica]|uniref:Uncharacterized protein n=1 Tax=Pseudomonas antarctica TaxID=219572 RepID=A0A172YY95_9PSED|nr:hypothetical protein A7J50_1739 [Pseudomonas antarctica]
MRSIYRIDFFSNFYDFIECLGKFLPIYINNHFNTIKVNTFLFRIINHIKILVIVYLPTHNQGQIYIMTKK